MLQRWAGWGGASYGAPLDHASAVCNTPASTEVINDIEVTQVNLNKSNSSQTELSIKLKSAKNFIAFVTKPAVLRQRLSNIPNSYQVIPQIRDGSPRAAIFSSGHIKIHKVTALTLSLIHI